MRLADHISFIALAIMAMMILILLMPDTMYGSNYHEVKARCTSSNFTDKFCKLRTTDEAIYFNGKWHKEYFVSATIMVDDKLNLLIDKKGQ